MLVSLRPRRDVSCTLSKGQFNCKGIAVSVCAVHEDPTAVGFNDLFHDREAGPGCASLIIASAILGALENVLSDFGLDSGA